MKKLSLTFALSFLLFNTNVFAQDWVKMMNDPNANFYDVQAAFNKWYSVHKPEIDNDKDAIKPGEEHEEDGNYLLYKRWEYMMQPRTYPSGKIPDVLAITKEYQDFLNTQNNKKSSHKLQSTATWTYAGNTSIPNGGDCGRVNRIRIDPNNSSILYACSPSGGLWKSINGGTSWAPLTDNLLGIGTSDVAIDPTNSNVMYLATGDGDGIDGSYGTPSTIGVLKTTDGGVTWQQTALGNTFYTLQTSGPGRLTVNEIAIDPQNTQILLAASSFGLFYTSNGGISWISVEGGNMKSVEFEPGNPKVVYATSANAGYYRSANGGLSFKPVALPSSSGSGRMQVAVTPANPAYVYVLADNSSNYAFFGIWLSTDTGNTFKLQATTPNLLGFQNGTGSDATQGQGWYTLSIAVSPTSATTLVVGGVNVWKSTTSGTSWSKISSWTGGGGPYVHADIHSLTFLQGSGTTIYASDDGGVNKTTNTGTSWSDLSSNLEIAEQYSIGLSGSNANLWITGWQDNGTNLASSGAWSEPLGGDGMMCFIDYSNDNYMYGEQYNGSFNMSSNGGASWKGITSGITETGAWVTPWLCDPQNSSTLFAGISNVWKSTNRGTSWTAISTFGNGTTTINAIAVAPSNDQYIYASQVTALYATTNGGTTWNNVLGNLPGNISNIIVDPANPLRVFATISGYTANQKVYMTTTGGTTWTNISTGLPNLPANCIVYQGSGIDAMYVGTDLGVYYRDTTNTGGNWVSYSTGLPNVEIADLKIFAPGSILRAATYGRGTWQIPFYQAATIAPVAKFTAYPTTLCATNTVQYTDTSANQPTSWKWSFPGGTPSTSTLQNPVITYSTAGLYPVTEVAINSIGQDSITVGHYISVNPLPAAASIKQSGDTLFCVPATYNFYQWIGKGVAIPGATSSRLTISATGVYRVDVSDSDGCGTYGQLVVSSIINVGINEISLNDFINAYPNPTTGTLQVEFDLPKDGDYELSIANVLGQTVYSDKLHIAGQTTHSINMSGFGKGIYFLSIKGNSSSGVKKIMLY
jgi:PKD repeat protein